MYYFKNISGQALTIPVIGATFNVDEIREFEDVANRIRLQDNSSYIIDLIVNNKLSVLDTEQNVLSMDEAFKIIYNGYTEVIVKSDLSKVDEKFYFLNSEFRLSKHVTKITKTFKGAVDSFRVIADNEMTVKLTDGSGLRMPIQKVKKRQSLEFEFDGSLKDLIVELELERGNSNIELYIDGKSTLPISELQTFIDNWGE